MFIWDFVAETVLDEIMNWIYIQVVDFLGNFFSEMGNMGAELFQMSWVQSIVLFFSRMAWALYGVGLIVSVFECGIEYSSGRGNVKATCLNAIKGFMAVNLFSVVPIRLYELAISLQGVMAQGITGSGASIGEVANEIMANFTSAKTLTDLLNSGYPGFHTVSSAFMVVFSIVMMAYAVIKVFFANLKRGGILLIQIAVGSLYMFSIPRGYTDAFGQWCKQVIALCLTAFLQATMLVAGLMVFQSHVLLGLGLMLAAGEIPRIAGQFGLETSARENMMQAVQVAQTAIFMGRSVTQAVA